MNGSDFSRAPAAAAEGPSGTFQAPVTTEKGTRSGRMQLNQASWETFLILLLERQTLVKIHLNVYFFLKKFKAFEYGYKKNKGSGIQVLKE